MEPVVVERGRVPFFVLELLRRRRSQRRRRRQRLLVS
jgi:hypothetical protein